MKKIVYIFLTALLISGAVYGQDKTIHGIVTTLDSIPLIGVEIEVGSTGQTVYTDSLGGFSTFCDTKDKLKVKANGFYNTTAKVEEKTKFVAVNLKLKPGEKQREYAIGYGHVSEEDLTSSILKLNGGNSNYSKFNDILDLIRSMGANVTNGQVILRGERTFQGSNAALLIVDKAIVDYDYLKTIKPMYVKSIDIIRDGTSSVYGSRGANGVVIIETLKGE